MAAIQVDNLIMLEFRQGPDKALLCGPGKFCQFPAGKGKIKGGSAVNILGKIQDYISDAPGKLFMRLVNQAGKNKQAIQADQAHKLKAELAVLQENIPESINVNKADFCRLYSLRGILMYLVAHHGKHPDVFPRGCHPQKDRPLISSLLVYFHQTRNHQHDMRGPRTLPENPILLVVADSIAVVAQKLQLFFRKKLDIWHMLTT